MAGNTYFLCLFIALLKFTKLNNTSLHKNSVAPTKAYIPFAIPPIAYRFIAQPSIKNTTPE